MRRASLHHAQLDHGFAVFLSKSMACLNSCSHRVNPACSTGAAEHDVKTGVLGTWLTGPAPAMARRLLLDQEDIEHAPGLRWNWV